MYNLFQLGVDVTINDDDSNNVTIGRICRCNKIIRACQSIRQCKQHLLCVNRKTDREQIGAMEIEES